MKGIRTARLGLLAYGVLLLVAMALGLWSRSIWKAIEATEDFEAYATQLEVLRWAYRGLGIANAVALLAIAKVPRGARASGLAIAASILAFAEVVVDVERQILLRGATIEGMQLYGEIFGALFLATGTASGILVALVVMRVARAAKRRYAALLAGAFGAVVLFRTAVSFPGIVEVRSPALESVGTALYYGGNLALAAATISVAVSSAGLAIEAPEKEVESDRPPLEPEWSNVRAGITTYLVAVAIRISVALLAFATMRGAGGASSFEDLRRAGEGIVALGVVSAIVGIIALVGVYLIGRGPRSTGASVPANTALSLMVIGMIVDGATTKVSADAFESVSAAFRAQDVLPLLSALATGLGVAGGAAILAAFRRNAEHLGLAEVAERAAATTKVLIAAGIGASVLQLGATAIPLPLFVLVGLAVLPALVLVAVRFVGVAVAIAREIRGRLPVVTAGG